MKIAYFSRIVVALIALFVSTGAFAASDYLLEIEGIKGECVGKHIKLIEQADGSFTAENIPSGTYKLIAKPNAADGSVRTASMSKPPAVYNLNFDCIVSPRDPASGQASGKRDAASGQATGKRQHKPMNIQKNNVILSAGGVFISEIVVSKVQDDATDDGSSTAKAGQTAGYDLKLNKKI